MNLENVKFNTDTKLVLNIGDPMGKTNAPRAVSYTHLNLGDPWEIGGPAPAMYASVSAIVDHVCWIGSRYIDSTDRRELYVEGMERIEMHEDVYKRQAYNKEVYICRYLYSCLLPVLPWASSMPW